ncbi:MetQ/NlpA family ABC transporter substrate-binding protein [Salinicoccus roseus]|jgi:D-methionine transport system substrate-binding protein|uniref:MetQ/NlpA family ABC transporter substrate-binding protein n=1 Tax=Salinicoccus roseus TaxID=45670 RepID=UPI0015847D05|nr:MetQ/NlpA family ABC transporter substrate-binding protein [Salinicoccus roseus]MBY8909541.1 MetQ/NlpA family ABC transporter substrate-binding protein [Salinicoccus roseus]
MKKIFLLLTISIFAALLVACGNGGSEEAVTDDSEESEETTENAENEETEEAGGTISIAASPAPHAEILEEAATVLEEEGIELDISIVNDYTTPNRLLADEEVDANYFQHTPYLETEKESHDYDITSAGNVHIEPMAVYSQDYDSLEDLPDGSTILVSNNPAEEGRFLSFFVDAGLVEIEDGIDIEDATFDDITSNEKNFEFDNQTAPELLVSMYENNEAPAVIINSNFALDGGLSPTEDSIVVEDGNSPYANLVAVRTGDEEREDIQKLMEVLQGEEIKQFIEENYEGAVIPTE